MSIQLFLAILALTTSQAFAMGGKPMRGEPIGSGAFDARRSGPQNDERGGDGGIYCYNEPTGKIGQNPIEECNYGRGVVCREIGVRFCKYYRTDKVHSAETYEKEIGCISWHDCR